MNNDSKGAGFARKAPLRRIAIFSFVALTITTWCFSKSVLAATDIAVIDVTLSDVAVGQGCSTAVYVIVKNQGDATETFDVTVYAGGQTLYDPFDVWNYMGAWEYYDEDATEGYVSVSDGVLHVSGYYGPSYNEGGLTTIQEFDYPVIIETKLRSHDNSHSPQLEYGQRSDTWMHVYYDVYWGSWGVGWNDTTTTGFYGVMWGGSLVQDTWYTIRLEVYENSFKVYHDDVLRVDTTWAPPELYPQTVSLSATYSSHGDFDWVSIDGGGAVNEIGIQPVIDLAPGEDTTLTFVWNTEEVPPGNHAVRAYAQPVPGETEFENNSYKVMAGVIIAGDSNGDGQINVGDVVYLINHIFKSGPASVCP